MKGIENFRVRKIVKALVPSSEAAYRIDAPHNDMRKTCGMGGSECCDYFLLRNNSIVLIDDTRLEAKVKRLAGECRGLGLDKKGRNREQTYIVQALRRENALKIYGTMLMLCRLESKFPPKAQQLLAKRKYDFWLVATDGKFGVDYVKGGKLQAGLKGTFRKAVEEIDIVSSKDLPKVLALSKAPLP